MMEIFPHKISLYKLKIKIIVLLFIILLMSCTSNQKHKRQINGDDTYLKYTPLKRLIIPYGISLPLEEDEYYIPPQGNQNNAVGKDLDIRPPIQPILLLNNTYIKNTLTTCSLFLKQSTENKYIWEQIIKILKQKITKIIKKNDSHFFLITDWISWERKDEDIPVQTKQKIQFKLKNNQIIITISNEGIKQKSKNISSPTEIQRYNMLMLNKLIYSINKLHNNTIS
ncbi:Outer membrane protein assembly factor BamC precursor [Candidatus Arsenophonus lipoptenae]|uniref:Outer membrane protein assembly factor BamC n=1 Tax=Candidatus Arsenophonus lipoptenae TaxID=634113 RepID=A0A109Q8X0_9GAMM|nr:outer membrane protein assembly factor BamC [Candidatus Arsenophonus lipoptenae]AMA65130.1 Outer membrane protein assembly factor BamC precursor [Candidatus Arsenophonus lipoptenae]